MSNLQKKLQIAFNNQSSNALCFFDLSGSETLRIDEFLFGVQFFIQGNRLKDCLMLFQELDINRDGMLDEMEFEMLFHMMPKNGSGKLQEGPMMKDNVGEEDLGNYMQGGYNTYNKRPLDNSEML